jgi:glycosyltransferase involved in cell wall biosynthesis/ADP-heptose:LPS heptosyltransferase
MRIAIDFQGAQTGSRFRGIGHYSTELVRAMIQEGKEHEFYLVLNGAFADTIEPIRAAFDGLLPQANIRVWYSPEAIEDFHDHSSNLREVAQIMREYFIRSLEPDVLFLTSIFEGLGEPAVMTVNEYVKDLPTAAIFYDFTPLIIPDEHFKHSALHRLWYRQRIAQAKNCDLLFTISESSRDELHRFIDVPRTNSINVFGGRSPEFTKRNYSAQERQDKLRKLGISKPFILYAGGLEPNKNLKRMVEGLAFLPDKIKADYEFVVVGKRNPGEEDRIRSFAADGPSKHMMNIVGYVSKDDLIDLYNLCSIFVFPSLREGFGLPPAEAMACGAPTIVSDRSSLPEVVANPDAEFDPESPAAIGAKINQVLSDTAFRNRLVSRGIERAGVLTWENSAKLLLQTLEQRIIPHQPYDESRRTVVIQTGKFEDKPPRILVMKLDHNGDFLLAVPAMTKLRARYPGARIDLVTGSWNLAAAEAVGLFDNLYTLDYFKPKSSDRPKLDEEDMDALLAQLPFYDYAIDLRRQPDTRFLLIRLPATKYFGYDCGDGAIDRFLTKGLARHDEPNGVRCYFDSSNASEQILKIIDALPFEATDYVDLPAMGQRLPVQQGSVAIFPRVGNDARQWDTDRFGALIDSLAANDKISAINLYGGKVSELDTLPFKPNAKIGFHTGLKFPDLLASLSANQVCLGNNSFGVHLGSYAGCQTIGIYSGHELPQHWGPPFGNAVAITADAPCSPCHLPDRQSCPYDLFCLTDISVQTVERVILEAVDGNKIRPDYAKIVRSNPASAIQPLLNDINNSKYLGRITGLSDDQKTFLGGAIAVNFPDRSSLGRTIYLDVTGLRSDLEGAPGRTRAKYDGLGALANMLKDAAGRQDNVVLVATGPHDHEYYAIESKDLFALDTIVMSGSRHNRIVRPLAGDIYIGPDVYHGRNSALWNLLATWRQNGVEIIMQAPETLAVSLNDDDGETASSVAAYLYKLAHFDGIAASVNQWPVLRRWLDDCAPPRLRPLKLFDSIAPEGAAKDKIMIADLLNGGNDVWTGKAAAPAGRKSRSTRKEIA